MAALAVPEKTTIAKITKIAAKKKNFL